MIELGFTFLVLAVILVMVTLGAVLLVRFSMGKSDTQTRTFTAAFGGPGVVLLPLMGFAAFETGDEWYFGVLGILILMLIVFATIGWPVAHFATRRLDRLTRFDLDTFE